MKTPISPNLFATNTPAYERFKKSVLVLVFSYDRHLNYIERCLDSLKPLDYFTVLAWDRGKLPPVEVLQKVDYFSLKHLTSSGVTVSWLWHSFYTAHLASHFDYIFSMSGDCIFEKIENLPQIFEMMGNHDIIPYWQDKNRVGTMAWICKTEPYQKIINWIWREWDTPTDLPGHMAEARVMHAVKNYGFTIAHKPVHFDYRLPPDHVDNRGRGLFGEVLGMRHLQYEDICTPKNSK